MISDYPEEFPGQRQLDQEIHQSAMETIRMKHQNNALERSLNTFDKLKAQYDNLKATCDYIEADRDAAYHVIRELRTTAGVPKEDVGKRLDAWRGSILENEGLSHLIKR